MYFKEIAHRLCSRGCRPRTPAGVTNTTKHQPILFFQRLIPMTCWSHFGLIICLISIDKSFFNPYYTLLSPILDPSALQSVMTDDLRP